MIEIKFPPKVGAHPARKVGESPSNISSPFGGYPFYREVVVGGIKSSRVDARRVLRRERRHDLCQ